MHAIALALVLSFAVGAVDGDGSEDGFLSVDGAEAIDPLLDYFVVADEVFARRGETVEIHVFLSAPEPSRVVGTTHDLTFDRKTAIAANERMRADCAINPAIERPSGFAFEPFGCDPHRDCTFIRVLFIGVEEPPISDRTPLYTCRVAVRPDARVGWYPMRIQNVSLYDVAGGELPVRGIDGGITVIDDGTGMEASDADGCQIADGPSGSSAGMIWVLGMIAPFAISRRVRARVRRPEGTLCATTPDVQIPCRNRPYSR